MTTCSFQRAFRKAIFNGGTLTGLLLGWAGADSAFAQAPTVTNLANQQVVTPQAAPVQRNYLNLRTVKLPIQIGDASRQLIQEIQLHMKDQAGAPWTLRDKVGPDQQEFIVQLPRDGEYLFAMVTVDRQGRSYPSDLRNVLPGLCVVIDTQLPRIELTNLGVVREGHLIQCDIHDAHLDIGKSRLSFQGGDRVFREMEPVPGRGNVFCIPAQAVFTGVIRVSAEDLAGNRALAEEHISRLRTPMTLQVTPVAPIAPPPVAPVAPPPVAPVAPPPAPLPDQKAPSEVLLMPFPKRLSAGPEIVSNDPRAQSQTTTFPPLTPKQKATPTAAVNPIQNAAHRPDGSEGPHWAVSAVSEPKTIETPKQPVAKPAMAPEAVNEPKKFETPKHQVAKPAIAPEPVKRQVVKTTTVFLDYQIENAGSSGVGKVEAWITRDRGQSWHKIAEDAQRKSPLEIHLPGEGLFGVTLVASNGRGVVGAPPATGDAPDGWIEVDTTKPTAQITNVRSATEDGQAVVHISWTAHDQNLGDGPVDLLYAATPQGPWLPIAKGLKAEGTHRWTPPIRIGPQAHLRLIAQDAAGNTVIASTLEPVLFDDPARPRAVIRSIRTSSATTQEPPVTLAPAQATPAPVTPAAQTTSPAPPQIIQSPRN